MEIGHQIVNKNILNAPRISLLEFRHDYTHFDLDEGYEDSTSLRTNITLSDNEENSIILSNSEINDDQESGQGSGSENSDNNESQLSLQEIKEELIKTPELKSDIILMEENINNHTFLSFLLKKSF